MRVGRPGAIHLSTRRILQCRCTSREGYQSTSEGEEENRSRHEDEISGYDAWVLLCMDVCMYVKIWTQEVCRVRDTMVAADLLQGQAQAQRFTHLGSKNGAILNARGLDADGHLLGICLAMVGLPAFNSGNKYLTTKYRTHIVNYAHCTQPIVLKLMSSLIPHTSTPYSYPPGTRFSRQSSTCTPYYQCNYKHLSQIFAPNIYTKLHGG